MYELNGAEGAMVGMLVSLLVCVPIFLWIITSMMGLFIKAGQPGWAALIPIYNLIVLLQIVGKPVWWVLLCLIPCVNLVVLIVLDISLAKSFGRSAAFGIGLALLGPIFLPILAFGSAQYQGPAD